MARWLPGCLLLLCFAVGAGMAQDSPGKKQESPKSNSSPLKPKLDESEPRDDVPPSGRVWLSPEKARELEDRYQKLREQLQSLERQLKKEKSVPSACKLAGRIDGDVAELKAEFAFATAAPMTTVFLGLKNGFLVDEGQLDDQLPHLESTDDGYTVRVEKEGPHRLTLNLRVPIAARKSTTSSHERGFDLSLPGAAVTTLSLDGPAVFKDLRANDAVVTSPRAGHWEATLGAQKSLAATWKELAAASAIASGPSAQAKLKVKIEENRVEVAGELTLEDPKSPQRDWHLLLPPQAKITPAAGSAPFTWLPPDGKSPAHIIRLTEKSEKAIASIQAQYVRTFPQQRLPVGPTLVQGVPTQGTILIQSTPGAFRGQRLIYHRFGEIFQRDPPKSAPGIDTLAYFQFWNAPYSGKGLSPAKAPLELEWKTEKGQIDARGEHDIKTHEDRGQWVVDVESHFNIQSANTGVDTLDMQLPAPALPELFWLGVQPSLGFPAALRWPVIAMPRQALPISVSVFDEGGPVDVPPPDSQHRVRIKLNRSIGKDMLVKVQTRAIAPGDQSRFEVELPKLIGVLDRGAKLTIWTPPGQQLLLGASGSPEPVHDRYQQSFDQMPAGVELGWRASQRERIAQSDVDLTVHASAIQVRQTLLLPAGPWSSGPTKTDQLALRLPSPGFEFKSLNAPLLSRDKTLAWIKLPPEAKDRYEIHLVYDVPLKAATGDRAVAVPLLWPERSTNREAKLRVWTDAGVAPTLVGLGDLWKDRPPEAGADAWPALVAVGAGPELLVALHLEHAAGHRLPALVADRSLVQVRVDDDGTQVYRCRYLVKKFAGTSLEVELPVAWEPAQPRFRVAGKDIGGVRVIDPVRNIVSVPLAKSLPQATLLEIEYRIPAAQVENKRFWQTPLTPPRIGRDAAYGATRWQLSLPGHQTPFVLGSTSVDYHWASSGWLLTPEPSVTASDLDAWIGSPDAGDDVQVSLAWWRSTVEPQRVYHFPRQFWLVLGSGAALFFGLLLMLTPLPRFVLGLVVLLAGLGVVALGLFHEYLLPTLFFACQPGLVVLLAAAAVQWFVHERTRRQLIFMPSFSRVPQGSTLVRNQPKPQRNPSTIDAPATGPGSSG